MLMFWVGEDGALRTKDAPRSAAYDLDCELSGRQAFGSVRVMPSLQRSAPEFDEGIGDGRLHYGAMRRAEEPAIERRKGIRFPPQVGRTFDDAMAAPSGTFPPTRRMSPPPPPWRRA